MSKNKKTHLSLEFPEEDHFHLKMMCAKQRKTIKDFVIESVRKSMREYDQKVLKGIEKGLEDIQKGRIVYRNRSEFEKYADE